MARNYEKNFGRLNRLWLEKETVKREKRPKLSTLKTSDEISSWLPSIKDELDFFLKQTEVPCYTDHKIEECRKRIHYLETEYKAFVRKLHQVNSRLKTTPWTARPYEKKDEDGKNRLSLHPMSADPQLSGISTLQTPVLMHDHLYQNDEIGADCESEGTHLPNEAQPSSQNLPLFGSPVGFNREQSIDPEARSRNKSSGSEIGKGIQMEKLNPLGLDYSSSEDEI